MGETRDPAIVFGGAVKMDDIEGSSLRSLTEFNNF
jgi:hypothetical protein